MILLILFMNISFAVCQETDQKSSFREIIFPMVIEYRLEEALEMCEKYEKPKETIAAKSMIYSLIGNRDENESLIEKAYHMLEPYFSIEDDYNIHASLGLSYGIQVNIFY